MKTMMKRVILAGILTAFVASTAAADGAYGAAAARANSSPTIEQMLAFAIQDEYLARAEYDLIMTRMGVDRPFSNIKASEEQHIAWLQGLFRTYGFRLPADEGAARAALLPSLGAAYGTGVQAEVDNIAMYESFLARDLPSDVRAIFERLAAASRNHLQAFRTNLARAR